MNDQSINPDTGTPGIEIDGIRIEQGCTPGRVWIFAREGDGTEVDEPDLGDLLQEFARRSI